MRTWRSGDHVVIEVADDGPGVTPAVADDIFAARSRGKTSTDGLGLGLHVARNIAEAHGGHLELVPGDHSAAVFQLTLLAGPHGQT